MLEAEIRNSGCDRGGRGVLEMVCGQWHQQATLGSVAGGVLSPPLLPEQAPGLSLPTDTLRGSGLTQRG